MHNYYGCFTLFLYKFEVKRFKNAYKSIKIINHLTVYGAMKKNDSSYIPHLGSHFYNCLSHMSVTYHDVLLNGELNRILCEEVINCFLKVCLWILWQLVFMASFGLTLKGKTLATVLFVEYNGTNYVAIVLSIQRLQCFIYRDWRRPKYWHMCFQSKLHVALWVTFILAPNTRTYATRQEPCMYVTDKQK